MATAPTLAYRNSRINVRTAGWFAAYDGEYEGQSADFYVCREHADIDWLASEEDEARDGFGNLLLPVKGMPANQICLICDEEDNEPS